MEQNIAAKLTDWAEQYNDPQYFTEDPIAFARKFVQKYRRGCCCLADVEIAAVIACHLAWGRRSMIVRDCARAFDEMDWKPYDYVMRGQYRNDAVSLHRTVKWSEWAGILSRLRDMYENMPSLEKLSEDQMRTLVFAQKEDRKAPNKKINMMRRWMVRDDGKVDLGLWRDTDPANLIIPLDTHVYAQASELGLTARKSKDRTTALEITDSFKEIFPSDPCKGDFALFGYGVTHR